MNNHVQFDDSYFKKTINEYQDWQFAFFRETGQNACDAKAKNIFYSIIDKEDYIEVVCKDDGYGMSKDILLTKFLVMGGSHKTEGSVGGFGYAKSIILFCHPFYKIETNESLLSGSFGRYSDISLVENLNGTKITVHIEKENTSIYKLKEKLNLWVNNSNLKGTKVFLNNEEVKQCDQRKMKYKNDTKIGKLCFSKVSDEIYSYYSTLWIRMRGMAMFQKQIYSNSNHFEGFVDLDAEYSQECLTANRDGLKPNYDNALNSLVHQLSEEMTSLQLDDLEGFKINEMDICYQENPESSQQSIAENDDYSSFGYQQNAKERRNERHREQAALIMGRSQINEVLESDKKQKETLDQKINSIISKIDNYKYPDNFKIMISKLKGKSNRDVLKEYNKSIKILNQSRIQKRSELWIKIVNSVLDVAQRSNLIALKKQNDKFYLYNKPINYGVIISEETDVLGCCEETNSDFTISFNPLKFKEKSLKCQRFSRFDMLQIAIHEVTHLNYKEHNEHFAYFLFSLTKAFNDAKVNINKI